MVHNVSAVLGLQDPKIPVHIDHNTRVADASINHLWDNGDPMGMERQTLNRLTLLTLYGSRVSHSLSRWLLKEEYIIEFVKFL